MEMRQLKICATCFDISVGLLRVLEMVSDVASGVFLDAENPSTELLLSRLYQVQSYSYNDIWSYYLRGCVIEINCE